MVTAAEHCFVHCAEKNLAMLLDVLQSLLCDGRQLMFLTETNHRSGSVVEALIVFSINLSGARIMVIGDFRKFYVFLCHIA